MADKNKRRQRNGGAGKTERRRPGRKIMIEIPEHVLTRLIDPGEVFGAVADEGDLEAATGYRIDLASAEIAQALVKTGSSLSYLHVMRTALEGRGYRRGYLDGALAAGAICHALARDVGAPPT